MRCPRCAERINARALVCRHCGYELADAEAAAGLRATMWRRLGIVALVVAPLLLVASRCNGDYPPVSYDRIATPSAPVVDRALRLEAFTWEADDGGTCKAVATVKNVGTATLDYPELTLLFYRGDALVGNRTAPTDTRPLRPGDTSVWDAFYDCPGGDAVVEVRGRDDLRNPVRIERPKEGR